MKVLGMEKYVELNSQGNVLRGMMHIPDGISGPVPFVILFHGFQDDRNEINFVHTELSRRLCQAGIGSVRFDFLGSGESDGTFSDITVSKEIQNGIDILDYVLKLDFVDAKRVALHGLSLGGCVASMVAGLRKESVCALSLWCPALDLVCNLKNKMLCGMDVSDIDQKGYADVEGLRLSLDFYEDCLKLDPYRIASQYDGPVNLVHGDQDITASPEVSYHLKEIYQERAKLTIVEGAEHRFLSMDYRKARMDSALEFLESRLGESK